MGMPRHGCPSNWELSAFKSGNLPADASESVARHLATCAGCRVVMDQVLPQNGTPRLTAKVEEPPQSTIDHVASASSIPNDQKTTVANPRPESTEQQENLGRYENLGVINKGGMGVIYRVRDRVLGRTVALKMIKGAIPCLS